MFTTPLLLQTFRERREWSWGLDFDLTVITTTLFSQFLIISIHHLQLCWFKLGHGMVRWRRRGRVVGAGADVRGVGGAARRRQRRRRDAAARGRVVREGGSRGVRGREGAQRGGREHGRARHQGRRRTFT